MNTRKTREEGEKEEGREVASEVVNGRRSSPRLVAEVSRTLGLLKLYASVPQAVTRRPPSVSVSEGEGRSRESSGQVEGRPLPASPEVSAW